ncbi:nuclear GTPase SLIP-GC-like isoform X2 [Myxocyprinus asiaticus]|uniref:nuclear GTPase SLIP-GC-like isoform X2 n=1 Tax=Myxocyprinus asiaticus TaxID=70543 RepID=UPI002223439C|nr:nuclear GTPase SLIP-GC-like isoform X2 [Myxocyprinus asiaticus]
MATRTISFLTWNVNGLKEKRDQKFKELQNADVVFLQETHIGVGEEDIVDGNLGEWHVFFTKYTSSQKGTAILVRKTFDFEYISDDKDNCGGYIVLKCKLEGQPYTLVSVYNHQTDIKTLDKLSRYLHLMATGLLLIGGDFNTVLNPFIDKACNTNKVTNNAIHSKLRSCVEKFIKSLQLVDIWRRKNPAKKNYTFSRGGVKSRLDYFFVPEECMWRVRGCEIRDSERPDHQPVSLEINNVPTIPVQKDPQIQSISQLLNLKKDLGITETDLLLGEGRSHGVSGVEIVSAVHSLQVSDTPRPDGIPASFYRDIIQDLIPYIKVLYDRIHSGRFNCSKTHFNESVQCTHDSSQFFFNADYLIIATILARRLDVFLEPQSNWQTPKESAPVWITSKTLCVLISLRCIMDEIERQKRSNPTLNQDFLVVENLLRDAEEVTLDTESVDFSVQKYKLLHQGCPLTPVLITLALKSYALELFGHLPIHAILVFKQSVIICLQREDLDEVNAVVENTTNELYDIGILSKGNGEPFQLSCLGEESKDEEWEAETLGNNNKEVAGENCFKTDVRDKSMVCEKINYESIMHRYEEEDKSLDVLGRSAIFSGTPKQEMAAFHRMSKNPPPLLPVPSSTQSGIFSDGQFIHPTASSQDMEIMNKSKRIMQKVIDNLEQAIMMHRDIISKIDKMDEVSRKKATIGIFGKSGEGKSSLLNAVLGKKDLLPSGCFGACTAVITQVEANLSDSNYSAEIELFSKEEWEKELKDLLNILSEENEDRNDDMIQIAQEKITVLYGEGAEKKTFDELIMENCEIFESLTTQISKSDVTEFAEEVYCYIQHSESSHGGLYWPLVKSVTFKVPNCNELLEHIVLVDIPGTGDCNKIRDAMWKSKLRECSDVWIVSAINRAIDDKEPWGILKHCIEELGPGGECKNIHFICTKTDDINPGAYMRSAKLNKEQIPGDKDQKTVCILHRNERAKTKVKEKFEKSEIKKRFSSDKNLLQVFTVSSNAFFDHSLNLEPSETEITDLQEALMTLNKNINRELTRDYVNEAKGVLSLIQSVQLGTDRKTVEAKARVHEEFEENLKKAQNELVKSFENIYSILEQCLSEGVEKAVKLCADTTWAVISPNIDKRGFHKTLQALCKNGGCYWSKNLDKVIDLNKQLAKHLHESIDKDFFQIFPVSGKTGRSVQEQIDKFSIIQSDSASPMSHHIQNFIKTEETKLKASLNRDVVERKKEIYASIQTTIEEAMASCYEQAAELKGIRSMKAKQEMLKTTVDSIKHDMFNKAKMEVLKKFINLKLYIMDALESGLKRSMKLSLSQTNKITLLDVSRETEQLERLSDQLYD